MKLTGKVAIVTGGGTGIGRAIAERFVQEGAHVCLVGRRAEKLAEVAFSLPAEQVATCPGDVTDPAAVEQAIQTALGFGKGIHILVNNAGMDQPPCPAGELDVTIWQEVLAVNLTGPFLMIKAVIPHMLAVGGGPLLISLPGLGSWECPVFRPTVLPRVALSA